MYESPGVIGFLFLYEERMRGNCSQAGGGYERGLEGVLVEEGAPTTYDYAGWLLGGLECVEVGLIITTRFDHASGAEEVGISRTVTTSRPRGDHVVTTFLDGELVNDFTAWIVVIARVSDLTRLEGQVDTHGECVSSKKDLTHHL